MDTAASSSGLQDFHDAEGVESSSSDDPIIIEPSVRLTDPATEVTERVCNQCKDLLLVNIKDDNGEEVQHWCIECSEGRIAKHEDDEKRRLRQQSSLIPQTVMQP